MGHRIITPVSSFLRQVLKRIEETAFHYFLPLSKDDWKENIVMCSQCITQCSQTNTVSHGVTLSTECYCSTKPKPTTNLRTLKNQSQNQEILLTIMDEAVGEREKKLIASQ